MDFDVGLNTAIKKLRDALGDTAENARFVETKSRRGYRFIAPVELLDRAAADVPSPQVSREVPPTAADVNNPRLPVREEIPATGARWVRNPAIVTLALTTVLLLAIVLMASAWRNRVPRDADPGRIHSLAVLPLENLSHDPEQEYFADGMTDQLTTELSKIGALRVISRTSVMPYKNARKPLAEIASQPWWRARSYAPATACGSRRS